MPNMQASDLHRPWRFQHTSNTQKVICGKAPHKKMLKMKVDPAICMKTQETMTKCHLKSRTFAAIEPHWSDILGLLEASRRSKVRSPSGHALGAPILAPDSWLLAPDFCSSKMKVHPGICMIKKGRGKEGVRYQVSGVRKRARTSASEVRSPSGHALGAPILAPGSRLLTPALQK
jgi:hypothetical protein